MSRVEWICLIGNSRLGARAIRRCGFEVGVLADRGSEITKELLEMARAIVPVTLEWGEAEQGLKILTSILGDPQAMVSFTELGLLLAAELAETRGLAGCSVEAARRTRDKALMREALEHDPDLGLPYAAGTSAELSDYLASQTGRGIAQIIKPVDGYGSQTINVIKSRYEALQWRRRYQDEPGRRWICEPLVEGPEFSVETVTFGGVHHVLGVTQKETTEYPHFVELGHVFPADIDADTRSAIESATRRALTLLGVENGATHTEIRLSPRSGPVILETHTRPGGDCIPELVEYSCGLDQYTLAIESILSENAAQQALQNIRYPKAAAIRFLRAEEGVLRGVVYKGVPESERTIRCHLDIEVGQRVPRLESSFSRIGYVMCGGENSGQAVRMAAEIAGSFEFFVDRDEVEWQY